MSHIVEGAPEAQRGAIAALLQVAFIGKIGPVYGQGAAGRALLASRLQLDRCLVALEKDRLLGVAGYALGGRRLIIPPGFVALLRARGLAGLPGWAAAALLHRREPPDLLLMDGIAVAPALRGRGIGTLLLRAMCRLAARHGKRGVRLDVVDTNPRARDLYEREGFVAVADQHLGAFGRAVFGFSTATRLERPTG
jgi:ribosomal protein S18 acetylase RimI-like enzyme